MNDSNEDRKNLKLFTMSTQCVHHKISLLHKFFHNLRILEEPNKIVYVISRKYAAPEYFKLHITKSPKFIFCGHLLNVQSKGQIRIWNCKIIQDRTDPYPRISMLEFNKTEDNNNNISYSSNVHCTVCIVHCTVLQ